MIIEKVEKPAADLHDKNEDIIDMKNLTLQLPNGVQVSP